METTSISRTTRTMDSPKLSHQDPLILPLQNSLKVAVDILRWRQLPVESRTALGSTDRATIADESTWSTFEVNHRSLAIRLTFPLAESTERERAAIAFSSRRQMVFAGSIAILILPKPVTRFRLSTFRSTKIQVELTIVREHLKLSRTICFASPRAKPELQLCASSTAPRRQLRNTLAVQPTFILLIAVAIHHPIWTIIFHNFAI